MLNDKNEIIMIMLGKIITYSIAIRISRFKLFIRECSSKNVKNFRIRSRIKSRRTTKIVRVPSCAQHHYIKIYKVRNNLYISLHR